MVQLGFPERGRSGLVTHRRHHTLGGAPRSTGGDLAAIKAQRGWTIWSLLGVAALIVIGALLFMKLMPVYLDNYKLQQAMQSVAGDPGVSGWGRRKVIREMNKILYIDYGSNIVNLNNALSLDKSDNQQSFIKVKYEVEVPLVFNVSALVKFNDQAEITSR